ncbi:arabinan endo-1,5-alpha-L-arabinosidase [Pyxidicoccus fallax]|uniref:Arabinan endo-1,5-alpha-L-arabinosidase n=1 Tax=Pyxidicoccus fallax TaxID=394095 RepID=A0A848L6Q2_9BACT|nr:arabinan endo-1,5-alpha-L-arabinosidase [Pyxidicoccus fallax]NMO14276.1 arabinan endo-1,5-alpha-L-arabinosidase [Pyxidicoccus fallax]NPC79919.1 arabinan endo-1,5-alpha-L-arabinosidase [Pyxidicoccus fallax]
MRWLWLAVVLSALVPEAGRAQSQCVSNGELFLHDPSIIKVREGARDVFYVVSTGQGIAIRRSVDLVNWHYVGRVFPPQWDAQCNDLNAVPAWALQRFATSLLKPDQVWSPDISYFGGRFHVYYAVTVPGSNRVYVGHASNTVLDGSLPWTDHGEVFRSTAASPFAADGPDVLLFTTATGAPRAKLSFGGFFGGVYQLPLSLGTGRPNTAATRVRLAGRNGERYHALEGGHLFQRGRYYYLVVNWDYCCGPRPKESPLGWTRVYPPYTQSTPTRLADLPAYRLVVGRSTSPAGPFVDRNGVKLVNGGGTELLTSRGNLVGPGGASVVEHEGRHLLVIHRYAERQVDGATFCAGTQAPHVRRLHWTADGWPQDDGPHTLVDPSNADTGTSDRVEPCLPGVLEVSTPGGGSVSTSCGGASCRGDTGSRVGVTVTPGEGRRFSHWVAPAGERCSLPSPGASGGTVQALLDCPIVNPTRGWASCRQRCQAVFVP